MEQFGALPYVLIGLFGLGILYLFRRSLGRLVRFLARTAASLGALALLSSVGSAVGITLGINLFNAVILALLGVPGFGLLLLLRWMAQL